MKTADLLFIIGVVAALGISVIAFPAGAGAIVVLSLLSAILLPILLRHSNDRKFIIRLFFFGLLVRVTVGMIIYAFDLSGFFGGDAVTYDERGAVLADVWRGLVPEDSLSFKRYSATSGAGWGMHYLVGAIYYVGGRNLLAAQAVCWVVGAAIGPIVYVCSYLVYRNTSVSRFAALMTAFFPAFVIWSSQLMKDGLIIFLLVAVMIAVYKLQERISLWMLALLVLGMFGILSLRFYIFYMVAIAAVGSFVVGVNNNPASIFRRCAILIIFGLGLTYLGVLRTASLDLEFYGNLDRVQNSRLDMAQRSDSGYGEDIDVSTTEGALTAIPLGFAYLMFAPFPWQATNLRQALALPETLLWWAMFPLLVAGIIYTIRHRLREALPMLVFSLMLTLAYSIFQGNVGTAYRQRTQIQVFLFIFIAVGWVLRKESKENIKLAAQEQRQQFQSTSEANA